MLPSTHILAPFERTASLSPERTAAEDLGGHTLSYRDLGRAASAAQRRLTAAGVRPGDRVGIVMRKSIDALVAMQAVVRAGAAYVPVDALAPPERAAFIMNDCDARAVIIDADVRDALQAQWHAGATTPAVLAVPSPGSRGDAWGVPEEPDEVLLPLADRRSHDIAFLLYTSGSTGRPKGVIVTHGNVSVFMDWCSHRFAPVSEDRFAAHAPLHFSLSVFNVYLPWMHGASIVLIDEQTAKIPERLIDAIQARRITVWFSTPTILAWLAHAERLRHSDLPSLRLVMFAGEPFPVAALCRLMSQIPRPRYIHVLGSTETHMMATYEVPPQLAETDVSAVPVGRVCDHFTSRVIDDNGAEAAPGVDGELCLSGPGVTPGYWRQADAMRAAFFSDADGGRWYRTGDIVRVLPDGNLEYRTRRDRMIKKRGNRIELNEIEACLSRNRGVREVAVVAGLDEELGVKVKAFVVPSATSPPSVLDLKAHCAHLLPAYMVPDAFSFSDALPRTATGKVDLPRLQELL